MSTLKYIIVEDDPTSAILLKMYLDKMEDLDHLGTFDGTTEAVLHIQKHKPDILFLDINISGLEGPEMVALLAYTPKVIIISSHTEVYMNNFNIEYAAFIQKPPTLELLQAAVEKCR